MSATLKSWGEWIRWILLVAFIGGMSFFDRRYVTAESYGEDRANTATSLEAIHSSIQTANTSIALLQEQTKTLSDHESRLRVLERGKATAAGGEVVVPHPDDYRIFADLTAGAERWR